MNDITNLLTAMRNFFGRHRMVESYFEVSVVEELPELGGDFRRVSTFPLRFELNDDVYTITYGIVIQDKVRGGDMLSYAKSVEQSIFVLSQLQDYMTSIDEEVEVTQGELFGVFSPTQSENIPTIIAEITASFMKPVYKDFDLD